MPPAYQRARAESSENQPPTERDIVRWLTLFIGDGHAIEIRAPRATLPGVDKPVNVVKRFLSSEVEKAAREALEWSGKAPAVYFVMNGIKPELVKGKTRKGAGASAADIPRRRWLLIDCDPTRPADCSATDAEKAEARKLASAVAKYLRAEGWPDPIRADSGNGYHLLYRIDLPADDDGLVKSVLETLAARFDNPACKVDRKVFDPPRLVKLYGTEARKGEATAERPHRFAHVLKAPAEVEPVSVELLKALAASAIAEGKAEAPAEPPAPPAGRAGRATTPITSAIERDALKYLDKCEPAIQGQDGSGRCFKAASKMVEMALPYNTALHFLMTYYNPRCEPPWSEAEMRHKLDDAFKTAEPGKLLRERRQARHADGPNGTAAPPIGNSPPASPPGNGRMTAPPPPSAPQRDGQGDDYDLPINEARDDPHRLARAVLTAFSHPEGHTLVWYRENYYVWNGRSYEPDTTIGNRLTKLIKAEANRQNREALRLYREQAQFDALAPANGRPAGPPTAFKVTRRLVADVSQAQASETSIDQRKEPPFWIEVRDGDPQPMDVMTAGNGIVDLTEDDRRVLLPHTPRLFSTNALPYAFQADAPPPAAWLRFLSDLWPDDPASIRELQKWFGYVLTPNIDHQKILLLIGSTRSGRSTIREVMSALVGRNNVASTSAVALANPFGLEPLLGKTLAVLGDCRTGDTHDAAVVLDRLLRISGADPVEVNRKGKTIIQDVLMRTRIVIISNEVPNFRDASKAIVARYLPLCTPRSFEGREDVGLKGRLLAELPGILNWAIEGRAMLQEDGRFIPPASAEDLIEDARALASPVAEFVAESCELAPDAKVTVKELWQAWKTWAEANGHQPGHRHLFGRNLRAATAYKIKSIRPRDDGNRFRLYRGIELKPVDFRE